MSRKKTNPLIIERIRDLASNPKLSSQAILNKLIPWAKKAGLSGDVPDVRTVLRYKNEYAGMPPEEKNLYRHLVWPEAMLDGLLPWEASSDALELLSYFQQQDYERPTIRVAQWFWRVTQGARDLNIEKRLELAFLCSRIVIDPSHDVFRGMESYLAIAPWRSKNATALYEKLILSGEIPKLPDLLSLNQKANAPSVVMDIWFGQLGARWVKKFTDEFHRNAGYRTMDEVMAGATQRTEQEAAVAVSKKTSLKVRKETKGDKHVNSPR